jgi:class 3 adenylate cyclase
MDTEMTAMGDAVNTTARLSSAAAAGEILVPIDAAAKAGVHPNGKEQRSLELKGKSKPIEVLVLGP